jgi:hypothetical protein
MHHSPFVFDLVKSLRDDPKRRESVLNALRESDEELAALRDGRSSHEKLIEKQAKIVEHSGFNYGLLVPQLFPRYPLDAPLDLAARPFMFVLTSFAEDISITLEAGRQVGKCATASTEVVTRDGTMTLGDIFARGVPTVRDT